MKIKRRVSTDASSLNGVIGDPILRQLLANRGVLSAQDLDNSLKGLLLPTLKDIDQAANIISDAVIYKRKILIAGDYDVDGMTGTALGVRCLQAFGVASDYISYYVPSRYGHGYGLNPEIVQRAYKEDVNLIITVDNGIAAFAAVEEARKLGIPVVITDHHEVQDNKIPEADAVVDPKRADDTFASKNLCGVAVLFYVLCATRAQLVSKGYYSDRNQAPNMSQFLDLVCIGTIGDVMTLDSNNRRLVKGGLQKIRSGCASMGVAALLQYLKIDHTKINTRNIAFDICPRFNAATRIKIDFNPAIALLLCSDFAIALQLAQQLDLCNRRRMDHEKVMTSRAHELYDRLKLSAALVAALPESPETSDATALPAPEVVTPTDQAIAGDPALPALPATTEPQAKKKKAAKTPAGYEHGVVLFDPCFMSGLVGLVANRMKESLQRPCMIFGADVGVGRNGGVQVMLGIKNAAELDAMLHSPKFDELEMAQNQTTFPEALQDYVNKTDPLTPITGSARSVEGIDLMEVFAYIRSQEPEIFIAGGGHSAAAGASIYLKDLERFRELFNEGCRRCYTQESDSDAYLSDGELPDSHLCLAFARDLESFGPWGKNYEEPIFDGVFHVVSLSILANRHLKLRLRTANNLTLDAIKFRASLREKSLVKDINVQVLYKLNVDRYFSNERLQLMIEAIEPV